MNILVVDFSQMLIISTIRTVIVKIVRVNSFQKLDKILMYESCLIYEENKIP